MNKNDKIFKTFFLSLIIGNFQRQKIVFDLCQELFTSSRSQENSGIVPNIAFSRSNDTTNKNYGSEIGNVVCLSECLVTKWMSVFTANHWPDKFFRCPLIDAVDENPKMMSTRSFVYLESSMSSTQSLHNAETKLKLKLLSLQFISSALSLHKRRW